MKALLATLGGPLLCSGMMFAQSNMPYSTPATQTNENMPARTSANNGRTFVGLLVAEGCDTTGSMSHQTAYSNNQPRSSANEMSEATMQSRTSAAGNEGTSTYEQSVTQADRSRTSSSSTDTTAAMNRSSSNADRIANPTMAKKTSPTNESNTTYEQSVDQSDRNRVASSAAQSNSQMNRSRMNSSEAGEADRAIPNRTSEQDMNSRGTPQDMSMNTGQSSDDAQWARAQQIASAMPNSCRISTGTTSYALRMADGTLVRFDDASNTKIQQQLQQSGRFSTHQMKIYRVVVKGTLQGDTISLDSIQI